jgi:hypothetical protein
MRSPKSSVPSLSMDIPPPLIEKNINRETSITTENTLVPRNASSSKDSSDRIPTGNTNLRQSIVEKLLSKDCQATSDVRGNLGKH